MRPKISTVIADLFSRPSDDNEDCDKKVEQSEHSKILNMNTGGEDDRVWTRIREIETTPALVMTWTKANSQSCLMKLLKIDPRNIVSLIFRYFSKLLNFCLTITVVCI
jgi:hypothetical protein